MAKVTRTKMNSKKWNKVFGEDRPIMEAPKVKHTLEQRKKFNAYERQFLPAGIYKYSFNY